MSEVQPEFDPIQSRRDEVAQYAANVEMYQAIAADLPDAWPARLLPYKDRTDRHAAAAELTDLDDVVLLGDLWAHQDAQAAMRAETIEGRKAAAILRALEARG